MPDDSRKRTSFLRQHVQQQVALACRIHRVHVMADQGRHGVRRGHRNLARIAHELHRQRLDRRRERGREQQRLPLARQRRDDALERRQKAHVEHAIGFVQHQRVDAGEVDRALLHVVDQPARSGDHHVHAAAQRVDLRAHADAAEDGGGAHAHVLGVAADVVVDLRGQFAGGREYQHARTARLRLALAEQAVQHGQGEGGGLAGAGLGGGEQVVTGDHQRDRAHLDRGRLGVALFGKRTQQRRRKAQRFEGHENS
jgi:hypothetical protein